MAQEIVKRLKLGYKALSGKPQTSLQIGKTDIQIPPISEQDVQEIKEFFPMKKFLIFGHARSGTTLLVRLIRQHPQVHCNYQAHFFTRPPLLESLVADVQIQSWLTRRSNRWNRGNNMSPVMLRAAADFVLERDAKLEGKSIVGDKSPNSILNGQSVKLAQKIYPDAQLIYIVRDGRDAALSHRFQSFIDSTQHLTKKDWQIREDFIQDPEPFLSGQRSVFTQKELTSAAQNWVKNVSETINFGRDLYGENFTTLLYEDLTNDPISSMKELWGFLGANLSLPELDEMIVKEMESNPDADWQLEKSSRIAEPLQKGKQGTWKKFFTPDDKDTFNRIAGETLKSWGYQI